MEHTESDFSASNSEASVPGGHAFLLRSKTGRGIVAESPDGLAALAGLRAFGAGIVAGSAEDMVNPHPRGLCIVCLVRLADRRATSLDCLVHPCRHSPGPSRRIMS